MVIVYWLLIVLMLVGVVGAIVPGIPGSSLIVISVVVWGALHGFSTVQLSLIVAIAVLVLSLGIDWLATYWGVKFAGASNWGLTGAIAGLTLGFLLGILPFSLPLGGPLLIIVAPIIGAFIGEFLFRRDLELSARTKQALQSCVGIVVGSIVGRLIQGVLAVAALIVFLVQTFPLVWSGQI
jgi:uncharacterized protein